MLKNAPVPFRIALTMAEKSGHCHQIGACLAKGRRVISAGYNQVNKSHPLAQRLNYPIKQMLHAEQHACVGVYPSNLIGASIYVVRLCRNGTIGLSKPCLMCQNFLAQKRIRKIYYTITDREFGYLRWSKQMQSYKKK